MESHAAAPVRATVAPMQQAMIQEARSNELMLAYLRSIAAVVFATIQLSVYLMPQLAGLTNYPLTDTLLAAFWSLASLVLLQALQRGWYHPLVRIIVPFVDAVTIAAAFLLIWYHLDYWGDIIPYGVLVSVTGLCVFLAFSGALRLSRASAVLTTVLGLAVFLFAALVMGLRPAYLAVSGTTIIITGLLGTRVAGIIRRIVAAEVRRAETDQRYQAAELAIRARDEILQIVSHDLRNPLNTIFMGADSLLETIPADDNLAMQRRFVEIIRRAGARMNHLVQDLLNVTTVESGKLTLHCRATEVSPLVDEALAMLAGSAADKKLELTSDVPLDLPAIDADPDRILQVFSNLVGNAMKFTPAGGRVSIGATLSDGFVRFSVADTGRGISPEELPKIFHSFWQSNPRDSRGIGLGLSIVQGLVEGHGGRVWAESQPGVGTTFHFTIPTSTHAVAAPSVHAVHALSTEANSD